VSGDANGDGYSNFTCGDALPTVEDGSTEDDGLATSVGRQKFA